MCSWRWFTASYFFQFFLSSFLLRYLSQGPENKTNSPPPQKKKKMLILLVKFFLLFCSLRESVYHSILYYVAFSCCTIIASMPRVCVCVCAVGQSVSLLNVISIYFIFLSNTYYIHRRREDEYQTSLKCIISSFAVCAHCTGEGFCVLITGSLLVVKGMKIPWPKEREREHVTARVKRKKKSKNHH